MTKSLGVVTLDFALYEKDDNEHYRYAHVKLSKRVAYNSKTEVGVQAHAPKEVRSDKFKTGKEDLLDREFLKEDDREIIIKRMPAMVKNGRCRVKDARD
ncbi:DNA-directed RNA polymerases IV and V subunit 2, partial [Mucuna pruriens]